MAIHQSTLFDYYSMDVLTTKQQSTYVSYYHHYDRKDRCDYHLIADLNYSQWLCLRLSHLHRLLIREGILEVQKETGKIEKTQHGDLRAIDNLNELLSESVQPIKWWKLWVLQFWVMQCFFM